MPITTPMQAGRAEADPLARPAPPAIHKKEVAGATQSAHRILHHSGRSGARAAIGFDGVAPQRDRRRAPPAAPAAGKKQKRESATAASRAREMPENS